MCFEGKIRYRQGSLLSARRTQAHLKAFRTFKRIGQQQGREHVKRVRRGLKKSLIHWLSATVDSHVVVGLLLKR